MLFANSNFCFELYINVKSQEKSETNFCITNFKKEPYFPARVTVPDDGRLTAVTVEENPGKVNDGE